MSTVLDAFIKSQYAPGKPLEQLWKEFPLLDAIPKQGDGGGDEYVRPVVTGDPQGVGPTLAIAQEKNDQVVRGARWRIPWGDTSYSIVLNDKHIKQMENQETAFINWLKDNLIGIRRSWMTHMSYLLTCDIGKWMGKGAFSAGVITLTNPSDIVKFEPGQTLQASANDGSDAAHTLLGSGSVGWIISRDENAGTVTVATSKANMQAGTAGVPTSWTGTMYYFAEGEFGGGSTPNQVFDGLGSWLPRTAPTAGVLFNTVDRAIYGAKGSGFRLTSTQTAGWKLSKIIKWLVTTINNRGTTPGLTHIGLNGEKWQTLADELEAKGNYDVVKMQERYGFGASSLALFAGGKVLEVIADRSIPYDRCFALTMPKDGSNIVMKSLRAFPHVIGQGTDGLDMLRKTDSNDFEHRGVAYPAFCVSAPGWCGTADV